MMSLTLDSVLFGVNSNGWLYGLKVMGSCIVMSQIVCIAFLDKIQIKVDTLCGTPLSNNYEEKSKCGD